jgi:diguanylate cyclase (GGDEF)-like protein
VTIVSADLDNLKAVNDRQGHTAGDELIRRAAHLLRSQTRATDRVARVGGDEFLVLMPETDASGGARYVARVKAAIRRASLRDGAGIALSLGAATTTSEESLASAIGRADAAMYAAKKRRASSRRARTGQAPPARPAG